MLMKTIEGHDVRIYTDNIEDTAMEQIRRLVSIDAFSGCRIRIMPDVHAGAGCVIGFTGDLGDKVIPNIVGVDIGCGMLVQPFDCSGEINFHALNEFILNNIPSGRGIRDALRCFRDLKDSKRLYKAAGTLGGGNHFIELDRDPGGRMYIVVHTGSRNLGKQVAEIYQKLAVKNMSGWDKLMEEQKRMIEEYKAAGRRSELQEAIRQLHCSFRMQRPPVPDELCWLEGQPREDYLHDMRLCQEWARINRSIIIDLLIGHLRTQGNISAAPETLLSERFESVHNYIGDDNIIRKGAISAREEQKCIIPMNMRDGSLICTGKGNPDWNFSAPHGAGRIMSRAKAFEQVSLEAFAESMKGIYSETVSEQTRDESPMVYKPMAEIIANIADTVDILDIIKPVFNFKAAE